MGENKPVVWVANEPAKLPKGALSPAKIAVRAIQITQKDQQQIVSGFKSQSYEMACNFLWQKTISSLKKQIEKLGIKFVAEMLNRLDVNESDSIDSILTEFEAIRLAEDLGMLSSTGAFRLRQARERVVHFNSLEGEEGENEEMTQDEAMGVLRSCVENVLAKERISVAIDFQKFREGLVSSVFTENDPSVDLLVQSPYFHQRTVVRVLMAIAKSATGAQLENAMSNLNVILPRLWTKIQEPERWQIGKTYADVIAEGKKQSSVGLKLALLKVKGFDYVPENLRSRSFILAAQDLQAAHDGINNFYNEPAPAKALANMGTIIPGPAFPATMKAVLSVRLGNPYGKSIAAQESVIKILKGITKDRWKYYLETCLPSDERVLGKLFNSSIVNNWIELVSEFELETIDYERIDVKKLMAASVDANTEEVQRQAKSIYAKLGYATS